MHPLISVIVPIYNTGDILKDTIDSILSQTFTDFEAILIDDGSTDETGNICDKYAILDHRVKVIHQTNGGICDARNSGLKIAKGKYITFCDHDDIFLPGILEKEYELAHRFKADMTIVGKTYIEDEGKKHQFGIDLMCENELEVRENYLRLLSGTALDTIWNILYRREVINDIIFDTKYKKGQEDLKFNLSVLDNVKKVISISTPLYIHYIREAMSTSAKISREVLDSMIDNYYLKVFKVNDYQVDLDNHKSEYIDMCGETLLSIASYMRKMDLQYIDFKNTLKRLNKSSIHIVFSDLFRCLSSSHYFAFVCDYYSLYLLFYAVLKIYKRTNV